MQVAEIRVWDPFIRVGHWLPALVVIIDWITDEPRWVHVWLGYLALAIVVSRVQSGGR
jgi:cytochrome b